MRENKLVQISKVTWFSSDETALEVHWFRFIVTPERYTVQYCFMFKSIHGPFKMTTKETLEGNGGNKIYEWLLHIYFEHNMTLYRCIHTHTHTYARTHTIPVVNWLGRVGEHHAILAPILWICWSCGSTSSLCQHSHVVIEPCKYKTLWSLVPVLLGHKQRATRLVNMTVLAIRLYPYIRETLGFKVDRSSHTAIEILNFLCSQMPG